ncbi:MAG: HEAT repeat domain-containing protein [Sedimentisphaerales bacterium]|nr:HEAT repeat domain-containing protein [Sedimentisphaerales bacterium]
MRTQTVGKLLIVSLIVLLSSNVPAANDKLAFWDVQRKGANCFNVTPEEPWFKAAHELGIQWVRMTYDKWKGQQRDFLMGDAGNFTGIVQEDLAKLIQVLDWADKYNIKVVIAPLSLPGNRWVQNNDNRRDLRLWNNRKYWRQAADFWRDLAASLKDHPAVYAYNILNEPIPEMKTGIAEHGPASRYASWYPKYRGTAHDLPAFYKTVIDAIRQVDSETPIMLDAGWYAQPAAFVYWPKFDNEKVLYSFHMYEPYQFTNHKNFHEEHNYTYPGMIPYAGKDVHWSKQQIETYLSPFFEWANAQKIPSNRLVCGEFGCYRRNQGCKAYLTDVIAVLNSHGLHWAFYSFREDEWDGYDYEIGTGGLGAGYWQAKEAGQNPQVPRWDNPLFGVIKREFTPNIVSAPSVDSIANPKVRQLIKALGSDEWRQREEAADEIWTMGIEAKAAIPFLIERLVDEEWQVRKAAAAALSRMGPDASPAAPSLTNALTDEEWQVRRPVAEALAAIGPASKPAVSNLIGALDDEEWHVRKAAAQALAAIGPASKPAVPKLILSLKDEEWQVRRPVAEALAAIGPASKPAVSTLIALLDDEEWQVRKAAVQALGAIGPDAVKAIPTLKKARDDSEDQVGKAAAEALKKITHPTSP